MEPAVPWQFFFIEAGGAHLPNWETVNDQIRQLTPWSPPYFQIIEP